MGQQNFRVKFSLSTKLALSLSLLFLVIVGFLSYSAVKLVVEDKTAYTFQLQSLEAYVAGQDFGESVRPAVASLRLYLTTFDPRLPLNPAQNENLKLLVNNQREAAFLTVSFVKEDGSVIFLTNTENAEVSASSGITPDRVTLGPEFYQKIFAKLATGSYVVDGMMSTEGKPVLVVAFADIGLRGFEKGMPVAVAVLDAKTLIKNVRLGETVITSEDGKILASTEVKNYSLPDFSANPAYIAALSAKLPSGTREFELNGVEFLGAYRKLANGQIVLTQLEKRKAMAAAFTMAERLMMLGVMSIVTAILFAILFSNSITKPLKRLTLATAQVARGEFNVDSRITTRDEVGALAHSFNLMSKQIQGLIIEQVHKAHMQEELKVAAAVQESLIPLPDYRDDRVEIFGSYESASECGGDWWGFFRIRNKLCLMIADATGHGVPSALITASARSCFSVLAKLAQENPNFPLSPGEMMSYANRVIYDAAITKIMMTFFIAVVDLEEKTISYSNAGHNPPWLFKKNGDSYLLKSLVSKGNRLGEVEESGLFTETTVPIQIGDILFLYTDGLMENKNTGGEQYGKKRVRAVVEGNLVLGPKGMIEALKKAYAEFNGTEKTLDDDVTLAAIRIHT